MLREKKSYRILIVDDMVENLQTLVAIFEEYHPEYNILLTKDSRKALSIALAEHPDLIITDWDMPEYSGIDLITELKDNPKTMDIPVIIATGVMSSSLDLQTALKAGAVDFLKKPIDAIELLARVNSALLITDYYQQTLEAKDHELAEYALFLVKNREFVLEIAELVEQLGSSIHKGDHKNRDVISKLSKIIRSKQSDDSLERFNIAFYSIHENFNKNLAKKFPNLTNNDIRLCSFIRLGMNTKDIASVLYQTVDSIKVTRSRLRKKLRLKPGDNLQVFLSTF